jgi:hypothetical protein
MTFRLDLGKCCAVVTLNCIAIIIPIHQQITSSFNLKGVCPTARKIPAARKLHRTMYKKFSFANWGRGAGTPGPLGYAHGYVKRTIVYCACLN